MIRGRGWVLVGIPVSLALLSGAASASPLWSAEVGTWLEFERRDSSSPPRHWTVRLEVTGHATIDGREYLRVEQRDVTPGDLEAFFFRSTGDAVYVHDGVREIVTARRGPTGTAWTVREGADGSREVAELVEVASVPVPIGPFGATLAGTAYVFRKHVVDAHGSASAPWYDYLVPGVGWVKQIDHRSEGFTPPVTMERARGGHFADVRPAHFAWPWIEALRGRRVTAGCGTDPSIYCPESPVTREQMAVFLLRAREDAGFVPAPCQTPPFPDVPCTSPFAPWVAELVARGITAGCGTTPRRYCPTAPVTREQMAIFLVRAFEAAGFTPDRCSVSPFADVPCASPFAPWIRVLVERGVTAGCSESPRLYCPESLVTRAQMAVFLGRCMQGACGDLAPPTLLHPYAIPATVSVIRRGFSGSGTAPPWDDPHDGIDITTQTHRTPIQAAVSGIVSELQMLYFEPHGWQVNVGIRYDDTYIVGEGFEILSTEQADGEAQFANITDVRGITLGDTVAQGQILGELMVPNDEALIHFGLLEDFRAVCPEPYLTPEAREVILGQLRETLPHEPDVRICYE